MADQDRRLDAFAERTWLKSLVAALFLLSAAAPAVARSSAAPPGDEALVKSAGFAAGDVGYLVVDLKDRRVLAERDADRSFIPASVAKIATIAAAMKILGADHRFTTTLDASGNVSAGVLAGSLTLRGGGDPSLTGDDLQAMARQLAAGGITKVDGSFVYDDSARIELPQIDARQPEAADYNCGLSALSVNFNRVHIQWTTNGGNRSAVAGAYSRNLKLPLSGISMTFAGQTLPGPYVRTGPAAEDHWLLSPSLSAKGEEWLPVANASRMTAEVFRGAAALQGVSLPRPTPGVVPDGAREVVRHDSAPLSQIARFVLRYSNNLSAELIGLAASEALTGQKLSLEASAAALTAWWRKQVPGANWSGLYLANHSGLSVRSHVTPRQIVAMLEEAAAQSGGADFHDLLPRIGWRGVKAEAHVKSGTMSYVRGLAGYIDTVAGHRLAFAVFFNDAAKRAALDAAFDPHVVAIDAHSRWWRNRALHLEEKLTKGWAERF